MPADQPLPVSLEAELAALRPPLLRFALLQLRNPAVAEDVVSETMLAILEKPAGFEGRSSLRTYATGVLKFKIIDVLRRQGREVCITTGEDQSLDDAIDALFDSTGHYQDRPGAWQQPDTALHQQQFMAALQLCIEGLPPRLARVFMAREWLEQEVDEICGELGITANNCGVMLHRARLQLRECLNQNWFAGQTR